MNWKAILLEAVIMALTTFDTVFFREMAAHYTPDEDFL